MSAAPRVFHVAPAAAWAAHRTSGADAWSPPSLAREGFVHLSFAEQVAGTLRVHFAETARVVLIEVDPASLTGDLRMERARDGAEFPHLYRALRADDLLRGWELARAPDGWKPPRLGSSPRADDPAGRAELVRPLPRPGPGRDGRRGSR